MSRKDMEASMMTRQEAIDQAVLDTKILQKVNAAYRASFAEKYPGQVEHSLRLVMERLQLGLDKRNGTDILKVDTWTLMPSEIADLAQAAYHLDCIRKGL